MAANDDLTVLGQFKEWLGDAVSDDEFGAFMDTIMERRGHKRTSNWVDAEGDGKQSGGKVLGIGGKRDSGGGSGWQYPAAR